MNVGAPAIATLVAIEAATRVEAERLAAAWTDAHARRHLGQTWVPLGAAQRHMRAEVEAFSTAAAELLAAAGP